MTNWKPISSAPRDGEILVSNGKDVVIASYGFDRWNSDDWEHFDPLTDNQPTHWAELPEPPKDEVNNNNEVEDEV